MSISVASDPEPDPDPVPNVRIRIRNTERITDKAGQNFIHIIPKIIKQRCCIREWSSGEGNFFFGLAIYRANILYRDLTVYNSRHPKQDAFWRDSSPTTYIIILSWWQHHQAKLPMGRMFTNTCSLSYKYMISMQ
jgi:hypothetical protein